MSAAEFNSAVGRLEGLIAQRLPEINEQMALNAAGMVKDRIVNEGKKADGSKLGKYSNNEIPLFFMKNGKLQAPFSHPLNKGGEDLVKKTRKANLVKKHGGQRDPGGAMKGISYKEWREANNRQSDFVDLKFSGQTMQDVGVVKQIVSGAKVITHVGAKNTKNREGGVTTDQVLSGWGERYGNVLEPNKAETEILRELLEKEIQKLIQDAFHS